MQTCAELFQADLIARRARLAELCERLALAEPSIFGRNAEELLWKKTYYDVFSMAKRLRKVDKISLNLGKIILYVIIVKLFHCIFIFRITAGVHLRKHWCRSTCLLGWEVIMP